MPHPDLILWGSELSPFALKTRAMLAWAELPYDWLPAHGSRRRNIRIWRLIDRAKRTRTAIRYPETTPLDDYPLVPYLIDGEHAVYYDSTGIARWVDDRHPAAGGRFVPDDPALGFVVTLIDEAFDEVGLYLVHHNRWVVSATTNDAGRRLASEFRRLQPPGTGRLFAWWFSRRQVHRLPYLFSVAPDGIDLPLPRALVPPGRDGFPPTHALLDDVWRRYLDALEDVLTARPFVLGERFTLADASVYGQLGMNLTDPTANERMRERAPALHAWLERIHRGDHVGSRGRLALDEHVAALLAVIRRTFVPLMRHNAAAYDTARARGETIFNERAFDRGRALYDAALLGQPFRHVVKTFQVQVWRELQVAWEALPEPARARVRALTGGADPLTPAQVAGGVE